MDGRIIIRLVIALVLFIAVISGWWFVVIPLGLIGAWSFTYFFEIIIAGIGFDALFGSVAGIGIWNYVGTIASVAIYCAIVFLKGRMR